VPIQKNFGFYNSEFKKINTVQGYFRVLKNNRDSLIFAKHYRVQEEKCRDAGRNCH